MSLGFKTDFISIAAVTGRRSPRDNAAEAALVDALRFFPAEHLLEVCAHVQGQTLMQPCAPGPAARIDGQHSRSPRAVATTS